MLTLALETSLISGSVALISAEGVLREIVLPPDQRSAQALAPAIEALLKDSPPIELVAVTAGPGSFTGLRVGVMTAKTLAFVWKCELIGVDTLEVLARQAFVTEPTAGRVHAVLDGQRKQLFAATFAVDEQNILIAEVAPAVVDRADWIAHLRPGDLVTGPGLEPLLSALPSGVLIADAAVRMPRAAMVGKLGREQFLRGRRDDWRTLSPRYLRPSAAEEKRALREAGADLSSS